MVTKLEKYVLENYKLKSIPEMKKELNISYNKISSVMRAKGIFNHRLIKVHGVAYKLNYNVQRKRSVVQQENLNDIY